MKHSLPALLSLAVLSLGLTATDSRADISYVSSEGTFNATTNDSISWNQFGTGVGRPNPFTATNPPGSIHVVVSVPSGGQDCNLGGPPGPFPSGENVLNNQNSGDVTFTFDHALAGFGVNLEDAFNGSCNYTITAYNVTPTATNILAAFNQTNTVGNHVTFVGVSDTTAEITAIKLKNFSVNSNVGYFLMGKVGLVTAVAVSAPVLSIVHDNPGYALEWPTNMAGFHAQVATNLSPTIIWQALGGSTLLQNGVNHESIAQDFGNAAFFRLSNVSP